MHRLAVFALLKDAIARNGDDPDGIDEIQQLADKIAEPVRGGVAKADERMKEEEADLERAKAISFSDGPWSDIRAAEQRDAEETFRPFQDGHKKTKEACADIMKGKDGPIVNEAIERLRKSATATGDVLDRDVEAWVGRARATYTLDCDGMKEIWAAYCSQDWEPGDEDGPRAAARAAADPIKDRMRSAIDAVVADLPALEARVKALADKRETQRRGQALQKELTKQKGRLAKLQANPALRGNYDLLTQYSNTYGKQRHASLWSSFSCKVPTESDREARFPKEGKKHYKPDCVNPETCKVYEFKPKGASGEREGADQKSDYEYNVPLYYNKLVRADGTFEPASSELGGDAVMKTLMQKCYRDGSIQLEVRLEFYDMCKAQYECTSD